MTSPEDPPQGPVAGGRPAPPHGSAEQPQHPYPSPYSYPYPYPYPPPATTSPWVWVSLVVSLLAVAAVALTFLVPALLMTLFAGELDDVAVDEYWVEQASVVRAVDEPCRGLASAAADVRLFGPPEQGRESVTALVTQMRSIVRAIDSAEPDSGARAWSADWQRLADALEDYAAALTSDEPAPFVAPTDGGVDVLERMYWGGAPGCEVPLIVEALDPRSATSYRDL